MYVALAGLLLCVACDRGTDELARKDRAWVPPNGIDAAALIAEADSQHVGSGVVQNLCNGYVEWTFYKQDQAFGIVLDLEAGKKSHLYTSRSDKTFPTVDTVMALYGPADTDGMYPAVPIAFDDDAIGASGSLEVWAAMEIDIARSGTYLLYISTYDGAGLGPIRIDYVTEKDMGLCQVDCGDAIPVSSAAELIAAIPADPWPCNTASTPGPWPLSADLCATANLAVQISDLAVPDLPGVCGTSGFPKVVHPEVDPALGTVVAGGLTTVSGLELMTQVGVNRGSRFRLRTDSRIDTAHSLVLERLTFLRASGADCQDMNWRCAADQVCYDRVVDGRLDPAYLYCLGCDHLSADLCACRSGKDTAADGAWCSVPVGEGATSETGTCSLGRCVTTAEAACKTLPARWSALLNDTTKRACTTTADCVLLGGTGTCDAGVSLGSASGDAVASASAPAFDALLQEFASSTCADFRASLAPSWDAAPARNLRCQDGACQADTWSCMTGEPRTLPYLEEFDAAADLAAAGWSATATGASTVSHWSVTTVGALGPDGHLAFSGTADPDLSTSMAFSPMIDAAEALADGFNITHQATLQWRSAFSLADPSHAVRLRVRAGNALDSASWSELATWDMTSSSDFALYSFQLPAEMVALQTLQVGFQVEPGASTDPTGRWDIDRVVVAAGVPNRFVSGKVIRCLDNGNDCMTEAGGQTIATLTEGSLPTLAMDACEHWGVALCYWDADASQSTWNYYGFPGLSLEGAPLDVPGFVTSPSGWGDGGGCETNPGLVQTMCGTPDEPAYFACLVDVKPDCQAASAGTYHLGFVAKDESDTSKPLHSLLESLVQVRLQVTQPTLKACVAAADCTDDNPCDDDFCQDLICRHTRYNILPGCCFAPADKSPVSGLPWADASARQAYADSQCDDGNPCTIDACDQATSLCVPTTPIPECCASDGGCDDGDPCTTDSCVMNTCRHLAVGTACCSADAQCDDQDPCTKDSCVTNSCRHLWDTTACCLTKAECDDQDPCTTDTCGTDRKCSHASIPGCGT